MNTVQHILKNKLLLEERISIRDLGRPTPDLQITEVNVTQKRTFKRSFNKTVYKKCSWLCGCEVTNKFYCFPCILGMNEKHGDSSWVKDGMCDLKHLDSRIKAHGVSENHLANELEIAMLGQVDIRSQLSSAFRESLRNHNETVTKNRYILYKIIDCIKFCGAFELALRGQGESLDSKTPGSFKGLINFIAELDSALTAHLQGNNLFQGTSKMILNELLESMLQVCRNTIKAEVYSSKYIAIQADETTDLSNKMQMIFIVRYVKNGNIYERFWGFLNPVDHTARTISLTILNVLEELEINKEPEKLIAQSYDGAAVVSGVIGEVQAKIKEVYKQAQYIHCYAHQLNLVVEKCTSYNKNFRIFFANLSGFSTYFSQSSKRTEVLDKIIKKRLPRSAPTRWNLSSKCVSTLFMYQQDVLACLEELLDKDLDKNSINQTQGLITFLNNNDFRFRLYFFYKIFAHTDILFNQLQGRQLNAVTVKNNLESFTAAIQCIKNNTELTKELINNAEILAKNSEEVSVENLRKKRKISLRDSKVMQCKEICDVILINLHERFKFTDYLTIANLFETEKFNNYRTVFPLEHIRTACTLFPTINIAKLKNELKIIYSKDDFIDHSGAVALLQMLNKNNLITTFSESVELLTILCTIPMNTVESERCFSTLKRIKTFMSNTMPQEKLSALAMLSIEKDLINSTMPDFNEQVMEHFANDKSRRMELHFKSY